MNILDLQKQISATNKPILIDFWAPWCGPCKMTLPVLKKLATEYGDEVVFLPLNADDARDVVDHFRIFGIPTVITLRDGKEINRITGAQNEKFYRALFESLVAKDEINVPFLQFDQLLRLGAGALFVIVGITTQSWVATALGGVIAFMGVYDRCPILNMASRLLRRR